MTTNDLFKHIRELQEIFPIENEEYLFSLLEEYDFNVEAVIDYLVQKNQLNTQIEQTSLNLVEMFPDESAETIFNLVASSPNSTLEELVALYYERLLISDIPEIDPSVAKVNSSSIKSNRAKHIYKAGLVDLDELEYNFTGRVSSCNNDKTDSINFSTLSPIELPSPSILGIQLSNGSDPLYYQNLASKYHKIMSDYFTKSRDVHSSLKGHGPSTAFYYSQEGYRYQRLRNEAERQAAYCIFIKNNPNWPLDKSQIDLHNLTVEQATQIAKAILTECKNVTFVTGRGNHSYGNCKLKPAIIKLAKSLALQFEVLEAAVHIHV